MKFGKLTDIGQVDFSLPEDSASTRSVLKNINKKPDKLHFYLGCTGWSMKDWVGNVYPKGAKSKDFLRYYCEQFNTIELNTTHYRIPTSHMISKWRSESTPDFKFCPKIPQSISHSKTIGVGGNQIDHFCQEIQGLEEKLGWCFIQLPPYFKKTDINLLERFLKAFPKNVPLAVELRHSSWFDDQASEDQPLQLLEHYQKAAVITDVAGRRDVLHMQLTTDVAMIRFVGNGLHPTDYQRVDEWIVRIKAWQALGLREVYFFAHEPDNLLAPQLAKYIYEQLQGQEDIEVRGPKLPYENSAEQMTLF